MSFKGLYYVTEKLNPYNLGPFSAADAIPELSEKLATLGKELLNLSDVIKERLCQKIK